MAGHSHMEKASFITASFVDISLQSIGFLPNLQILEHIDHGFQRVTVRAALCEPWSTGPVEGHVNRLKAIKRDMYGRAGFELLRGRILGRA